MSCVIYMLFVGCCLWPVDVGLYYQPSMGNFHGKTSLLVIHDTIKVDLGPLSRSGPRLLLSVVTSDLLKHKLGCV